MKSFDISDSTLPVSANSTSPSFHNTLPRQPMSKSAHDIRCDYSQGLQACDYIQGLRACGGSWCEVGSHVCMQTAKQCAILGPLIRRQRLNDWQALILHLLWEREKGSGSFWAPYISMLPPQAAGDASHPLSWDEVRGL